MPGTGSGRWGSAPPAGWTSTAAPSCSARTWPGATNRCGRTLQRLLRRPVLLTNDADAAGWAEWRFGAGQGESRLVCITLGTGIGGAMVMDGRLERGRFGVAGEFGHQIIMPGGHRCECGNRGCWEQYASGNALGREAQGTGRGQLPGGPGTAAGRGRPRGRHHRRDRDGTGQGRATRPPANCSRKSGNGWGWGWPTWPRRWIPGTFVIGGGLCEAGELLLGPARQAFARNLTGRGFRPAAEIELAALGTAGRDDRGRGPLPGSAAGDPGTAIPTRRVRPVPSSSSPVAVLRQPEDQVDGGRHEKHHHPQDRSQGGTAPQHGGQQQTQRRPRPRRSTPAPAAARRRPTVPVPAGRSPRRRPVPRRRSPAGRTAHRATRPPAGGARRYRADAGDPCRRQLPAAPAGAVRAPESCFFQPGHQILPHGVVPVLIMPRHGWLLVCAGDVAATAWMNSADRR